MTQRAFEPSETVEEPTEQIRMLQRIRELEEAHLLNAGYGVHTGDPEFGHRFMFDELVAAGHVVSE